MPSDETKTYVERKGAELTAKQARVRVTQIPARANPKLAFTYEIGMMRDPDRVIALSFMEKDARKRAYDLTKRDPQLIDLTCTQVAGGGDPPYLSARFVFYVGRVDDARDTLAFSVVGMDVLTLPGKASEKTRMIELD